jgi:Uma2 family endonuclease
MYTEKARATIDREAHMRAPTLIRSVEEYKDWMIDTLPNQGQWTDEEYLWLTDSTRRLVEFTDAHVEVLPSPTRRHQAILLFVLMALREYILPRGGTALFAPLRLRIRPRKFREPDVLLVKDANDRRAQNRFWTGADLVVEVVSEDDPERDLVEKRADYAEGGIPEYWIVNPLDETITVLKLDGGAYTEHGVFGRGSDATSAALPGFGVRVDRVFDAE